MTDQRRPTDHVLDAIDHAVTDWETSPDAMRCGPNVPDPHDRSSVDAWIARVEERRAAYARHYELMFRTMHEAIEQQQREEIMQRVRTTFRYYEPPPIHTANRSALERVVMIAGGTIGAALGVLAGVLLFLRIGG